MQFLQLTLGYSALQSALGLLPMAAIVMPMSRVAPHLVDRFGQRAVMTTGLAFLAGGLVVMSQLGPDSTYWHFLGGLGVFGFGMALTSTPSTTAIVTSLPTAKQGVASAMNDVSRELGSALGIAILGSLFNSGYREAIGDTAAELSPEAAYAVGESAGAGLAVASHLGAGGEDLASVVQGAFAAGLSDAMLAGAVLAIVAAGFTAWRGPRHARPAVVDHVLVTLDVEAPVPRAGLLIEGAPRPLVRHHLRRLAVAATWATACRTDHELADGLAGPARRRYTVMRP